MTLRQYSVLAPASEIPVLVTALGIHYFSSSCQKKSLNEPFQEIKFHHDAPNSHVPDINFLEFLVHTLSTTSYHS